MTFDGKENLQTRQNFGSKIEISRPWFLKFFVFLTKWLNFRYQSNGTFCCLWHQKQLEHPFDGFRRPWFLTCNPKNFKISQNFLKNCNFRTVCTRFFQFLICPSIENFMFFLLTIVTKLAQVSTMNYHDLSRLKLLIFWFLRFF